MVDGDGVGPGRGLERGRGPRQWGFLSGGMVETRYIVDIMTVWECRNVGKGGKEGRRTNLKSVLMLRRIRPSPQGVHSSDYSFLLPGSM